MSSNGDGDGKNDTKKCLIVTGSVIGAIFLCIIASVTIYVICATSIAVVESTNILSNKTTETWSLLTGVRGRVTGRMTIISGIVDTYMALENMYLPGEWERYHNCTVFGLTGTVDINCRFDFRPADPPKNVFKLVVMFSGKSPRGSSVAGDLSTAYYRTAGDVMYGIVVAVLGAIATPCIICCFLACKSGATNTTNIQDKSELDALIIIRKKTHP